MISRISGCQIIKPNPQGLCVKRQILLLSALSRSCCWNTNEFCVFQKLRSHYVPLWSHICFVLKRKSKDATPQLFNLFWHGYLCTTQNAASTGLQFTAEPLHGIRCGTVHMMWSKDKINVSLFNLWLYMPGLLGAWESCSCPCYGMRLGLSKSWLFVLLPVSWPMLQVNVSPR